MTFNYYCGHDDYYFAQFCPTCPIIKVYTEHDTFVYVPCPVCPAVQQQCPGKTPGSTSPAEASKRLQSTGFRRLLPISTSRLCRLLKHECLGRQSPTHHHHRRRQPTHRMSKRRSILPRKVSPSIRSSGLPKSSC